MIQTSKSPPSRTFTVIGKDLFGTFPTVRFLSDTVAFVYQVPENCRRQSPEYTAVCFLLFPGLSLQPEQTFQSLGCSSEVGWHHTSPHMPTVERAQSWAIWSSEDTGSLLSKCMLLETEKPVLKKSAVLKITCYENFLYPTSLKQRPVTYPVSCSRPVLLERLC